MRLKILFIILILSLLTIHLFPEEKENNKKFSRAIEIGIGGQVTNTAVIVLSYSKKNTNYFDYEEYKDEPDNFFGSFVYFPISLGIPFNFIYYFKQRAGIGFYNGFDIGVIRRALGNGIFIKESLRICHKFANYNNTHFFLIEYGGSLFTNIPFYKTDFSTSVLDSIYGGVSLYFGYELTGNKWFSIVFGHPIDICYLYLNNTNKYSYVSESQCVFFSVGFEVRCKFNYLKPLKLS